MTSGSTGTLRQRVFDNLGLTVSAAIFLLIALRVLAVAQYDVLTATAIVQAGGAVNVALGSALASSPSVGILLLLFVTVGISRTFRGLDEQEVGYWRRTPIIWAFVGASFVAPWWGVVACVAILAWTVIRRRWMLRKGKLGESGLLTFTLAERNAWFVAMIASQALTVSSQPWLPTEMMKLDGHGAVGYVLGEAATVTTVLVTEPERRIERHPTAEVRDREICRDGGRVWNSTILGLLAPPPAYPNCSPD